MKDKAGQAGGDRRRLIGYARVSAGERNLGSQVDALRSAGCERVFRDDGVLAVAAERPGLNRALRALRPGDVLVVWRLDRIGSSLQHLIEIVQILSAEGCGFQSLTDSIDTGRASGRYFLATMRALSEFESRAIAERTRAGLDAARGRGKRLGRRHLMSEKKLALALRLIAEDIPRKSVAAACGVSVPTLYRELARHRAAQSPD